MGANRPTQTPYEKQYNKVKKLAEKSTTTH